MTAPGSAHGELLERNMTRREVLAGALAGGMSLVLADAARAAPVSTRVTRGGRLRVAIIGGGSKESLDPHGALNEMDIARARVLFENLTDYAPDGRVRNRLAADFSANRTATVWKVALKPDVSFHDGSPLTADDVVYSLRRITDPKNKLQGAADLPFLKPSGIRRLDRRTVELRLLAPTADIRTPLAARAISIVKADATFERPIGTGPFAFVSWKRGSRTTLRAFREYRVHDGPYLDELQLISITDPAARLNALRSGQVEAIVNLDAKLVRVVQADPRLKVLQSRTGGFTPQTMQVNAGPFRDVRVRQAFRLLVDRKQIVQNALLGYGSIGNDLFCPFDEYFAKGLPPRPYDPERARSLLKSAGQEGLTVSLYTSDAAQGMLESSTLIAEQAKKAGVTILLDRVPADQFWTAKYLKTPFGCSQWSQKPLDTQILQAVDSKAPYNETAFKNVRFDKLTREARKTLDAKRRKELYVEAQRILYDEGGYIIWGFPNLIDAHSAKVVGIRPSSARNLGYYEFNDVRLT